MATVADPPRSTRSTPWATVTSGPCHCLDFLSHIIIVEPASEWTPMQHDNTTNILNTPNTP
jgi:hypothetical protein